MWSKAIFFFQRLSGDLTIYSLDNRPNLSVMSLRSLTVFFLLNVCLTSQAQINKMEIAGHLELLQ